MRKKKDSGMSVDTAKEILRSAQLRCTAARIAVIQCLDASAVPMTPVAVSDDLRDIGFDKSTIYRSLSELNDANVVTRLDLGDAVRRFELLPEGHRGTSDHAHFMCVDCGEVVCLSDFTVQVTSSSKKKRVPGVISEVLVRGHCEDCHS